MGSPRPRNRKQDKHPTNAAVVKKELVLVQLTLPGYKPIQGILSVENDKPVELSQIIEDTHILVRDMYLNLKHDGN